MITLEEAKEYLKIDNNSEDQFLNILLNATETYISSSCDQGLYRKDELAKSTQLILIGMLYTNRGMTEGKENQTMKVLFDAMMLKIKTNSTETEVQ